MTRTWMPTPWATTQTLHSAIAIIIVQNVVLLGWSPSVGFWTVVVVAFLKEFVFDINMEIPTTWGEEVEDFAFYVAAAGLTSHLYILFRGP